MPTGNLIEAKRVEWKHILDISIMGVLIAMLIGKPKGYLPFSNEFGVA